METRPCLVCERLLPRMPRSNHRYCSGCCRSRAHRIRHRPVKRPARARGHSRVPPAAGHESPAPAATVPTDVEKHWADERARLQQEVDELRRQLDEERAQRQKQEAAWREELNQERARHEEQEAEGLRALQCARQEFEALRATAGREARQARSLRQGLENMLKLTTSQLRNERKSLKDAQEADSASQAALKKEQNQRARLQKQIERFSDADDLSDQPLSLEVSDRAPALEAMQGKLETAQRRVSIRTAENAELSGQLRSAHIDLSQLRLQATSAAPVPKAGEPMAGFLTRAFDKLLSGLAGGFGFEVGRLLEATTRDTSRMLPAHEPDCELVTITISYPRAAERELVALPTRPRRGRLLAGVRRP